MMSSRSASVLRHNSSTTELINKLEQQFEEAGSDATPILVNSDEQAASEFDKIAENILPDKEWDDRVAAMKRGMGLTNGGLFDYEYPRQNAFKLYEGLSTAVTNLRSALVRAACLFISHLAKELGQNFIQIGDLVSPMSTQLAHGTQVIADSCKFGILTVVKHCHQKRILASILDLSNQKGAPHRAVAARALNYVIELWNPESFAASMRKVDEQLIRLASDASPEVRSQARLAIRALISADRQRANAILAKLDARTRKAIEEGDSAASTVQLDRVKPLKAVRRAPSLAARPSATTQIIDKVKEFDDSSSQKSSIPVKKTVSKIRGEVPRRAATTTQPRISAREPDVPEPEVRSKRETAINRRTSFGYSKTETPVKKTSTAVKTQNSYHGKVETPQRRTSSTSTKRTSETPSRRATGFVVRPPPSAPAPEPEPHDTFEFIPGQERIFFTNIKNAITRGDVHELEPYMSSIPEVLITSCHHSSYQIYGTALSLIHDLLPAYPDFFVKCIPELLKTLINLIQQGSKASTVANQILDELPTLLDVNEIVKTAVTLPPSSTVLSLLCNCITSPSMILSNTSVCVKILKSAYELHATVDIKVRHTIAKIFTHIYAVNFSSLQNFYLSLTDSQRKELSRFLKPYIPDLVLGTDNVDIPPFTGKAFSSWLKKISEITANTADSEWETIRGPVYEQLNAALTEKPDSEPLLLLVFTILRNKGTKEFFIMLPGILLSTRMSKSAHVDNILSIILKDSDINELVTALQDQILGNNPVITRAAIEVESRLIVTIPVEKLTEIVETLIPTLTRTINSEAVEIRKATVACFVELKVILGTRVDPYLSRLLDHQQKLISLFYQRRVSKN